MLEEASSIHECPNEMRKSRFSSMHLIRHLSSQNWIDTFNFYSDSIHLNNLNNPSVSFLFPLFFSSFLFECIFFSSCVMCMRWAVDEMFTICQCINSLCLVSRYLLVEGKIKTTTLAIYSFKKTKMQKTVSFIRRQKKRKEEMKTLTNK